MGVTGKGAAGCVAHDRGRPRDLAADAEEHAPFDAGGGAWNPIHLSSMNQQYQVKPSTGMPPARRCTTLAHSFRSQRTALSSPWPPRSLVSVCISGRP